MYPHPFAASKKKFKRATPKKESGKHNLTGLSYELRIEEVYQLLDLEEFEFPPDFSPAEFRVVKTDEWYLAVDGTIQQYTKSDWGIVRLVLKKAKLRKVKGVGRKAECYDGPVWDIP